ncbi:hypothetical protein RYZ27_03070 [Hyphomonas sp. FCG-A18]|uniref:hypothetical protein n=1 Tax=Hyphomonas sp. FCG-A18 TaxID=3080019 RepID=UPI002B28A7C6|nr:hypothetical protein RYZ27_03070 [Hyphomonas sp. FCG-A18]
MEELSASSENRYAAMQQRLNEARRTGRWLLWSGLGLAFLWWGAAFGGTVALVGMSTIQAAQPALIIAGSITILLPGLLMIVASLFAKEQVRASAANALVLEAASQLLRPLETTSAEGISFAQSMAKASSDVDKTMNHALTAMRAVSEELGDERQRLESVTYASADNARELSVRLAAERNSMEQLTSDLQGQTQTLNDAIPRQVKMMVDAASMASAEVATAEEGLKERLASLNHTGQSLKSRIEALDTLAAEAGKRNETLLFAITRMEEKLEQSRKTVETASRAGELAAAAASTTGDRLIDSVKAALDQARQASKEIQEQSFQASESAANALAKLKAAGRETASAVQAAKDELDTASFTPKAVEEDVFDIPETPPEPPKPAPHTKPDTEPVNGVAPSPSRVVEEDLFDASADRMADALLASEPLADEDILEAAPEPDTEAPDMAVDAVFEEEDGIDPFEAELASTPAPIPPRAVTANGNASLSEIIADMEREDTPALSREETAEQLIIYLGDSGIRLGDIFKPKDKKKIALSARKGDTKRRMATRQSAGRQVERVRSRLRGDSELMSLARDFVALEESDALNALENTRESRKNASSRLATYLLVDAALD